VLTRVRRDRYGREKTWDDIASELLDISATTVWRALRGAGLKKTKHTRKLGLTDRMRTDRLNWGLEHQHWTLEDFKNVTWTDETSVILLHRRRGYRIGRTQDEAFLRRCIRERWKEALNLCSGATFLMIKRALITAGFLRLLLSVGTLRL